MHRATAKGSLDTRLKAGWAMDPRAMLVGTKGEALGDRLGWTLGQRSVALACLAHPQGRKRARWHVESRASTRDKDWLPTSYGRCNGAIGTRTDVTEGIVSDGEDFALPGLRHTGAGILAQRGYPCAVIPRYLAAPVRYYRCRLPRDAVQVPSETSETSV